MDTRVVKAIIEDTDTSGVFAFQPQERNCGVCGAATRHMTVVQASKALGISETAVFRLSESRQIHSVETREGRLMICADSIARFERANQIYSW